jgi:hypothetical protein
MLKTPVLYFLALCLTCSIGAKAQQWAIDAFAGTANYQGDLVEKRYTMFNSKIALGIGASYIINNHFRVRGLLSFAKITGDDKDNDDPFLLARNLNFFSIITEFSVTAHYDILDLRNHRVTPYLFAGLGLFRFNPYTFDSVAGKTFLQPLGTEGQGIAAYPDRKPYSLTQLNIPFGGGIKFRVNNDVSIAWEIGLRKTFTDYLDDLSTTYVDQATLISERGQLAANVAWRGDEVKNNPTLYPPDGTVRGGPNFKDWFYFSGITATFNIHAGPAYKESRKGSTACPKKF